MTGIKRFGALHLPILLTGAALTSACVSTGPTGTPEPPHAPLQPIPPGSTVHVIGGQAAFEALDERTAGRRAAGAAAGAVGAVGGAAAGAAAGLLVGTACGPLIVFCAPIGFAVGAVGGAVGGGVIGYQAVDTAEVRPASAAKLPKVAHAVMSETTADFAASQPLVDAFLSQSAGCWIVTESGDGPDVILKIEELYLAPGTNAKLVMKMVSSMTIRYGLGATATTRPMTFSYTSPEHDVSYWLVDEGAGLRAEIHRASARQVTDMIQLLEESGQRELGNPAADAQMIL